MLDVKPKWNINGIVEEVADCGDVDTAHHSRDSRRAVRGTQKQAGCYKLGKWLDEKNH